MPSEITGEKAERTKARSISLQTWIRPFWMTVSVTGSRFVLMIYSVGRRRQVAVVELERASRRIQPADRLVERIFARIVPARPIRPRHDRGDRLVEPAARAGRGLPQGCDQPLLVVL